MSDLVKRLREPFYCDLPYDKDKDEAADEIERLTERVRELEAGTSRIQEMELTNTIHVMSEHGGLIFIPAGTVFKFSGAERAREKALREAAEVALKEGKSLLKQSGQPALPQKLSRAILSLLDKEE